MKKIYCLAAALVLSASIANAKPVNLKNAQEVAKNFYSQNNAKEISSLSLAYTGKTENGASAYYVFNINDNDGFVIVSADDAAQPIIGYSDKNSFVIPETGTTIHGWLSTRGKEIDFIQKNNILPSGEIALRWLMYQTNNQNLFKQVATTSSLPVSVAPLVQSTWNQSPFYNAMCPHNSVTGCVATAMAQIMRYWSYPLHGTGSSSYCDCSADGFSNNYGTLSADYGAATYNWSNMPLSASSSNTDLALINYHCGVSVEMDYDPNGSGAWVIIPDASSWGGGDTACSQRSYVKYFGYDPNTIQGLYRDDFDDSTWKSILKTDLSIGRPIQYVGDDPVQYDGHTWVCDGYDQNDYFHMNWGWGGFDNGWFLLDNLQTNNGGFNPSADHEAVVGIVPIASYQADAGVSSISQPSGSYCINNFTPTIRLQNFGTDNLTSCDVYYSIDGGTAQVVNWNGSLVTGQAVNINLPSFTTTTAGTHTLVCYSSNPNTTVDGNSANDQSTIIFNVTLPGGVLPFVEGFESTSLLNTSVWGTSHTIASGTDWTVTSNGAATGSKSCMIDNFNNVGGNGSILQTSQSYDLTQFTSPVLSFKVAYQTKTSATNNDHLQVFTSTNCGNGWISRWSRTSSVLSSGVSATPYMPASTDFTTYTVSLTSLATSTSVLFKWEFFADANGAGNNMYIDDINIIDAPASNGIATISALKTEMNLYPNPSNGTSNLAFNLTEEHHIAIQVNDMLGRVVESVDSKLYQTGQSIITLGSANKYQAGVYMVTMSIDGQPVSKKLVVQ